MISHQASTLFSIISSNIDVYVAIIDVANMESVPRKKKNYEKDVGT